MNAFLIDIDTLKKIGYTNKNVDAGIIATTLRRVQDTMLLPILGTTFFKKLLQSVDDNVYATGEQDLLNDYIAPVLIAGVDLRITNHLAYEIRSKTVGTSRDEHISTVAIPEMLMLQDDLRGDFDVYRLRLIGFLKDNCDLFPTYKNWICSFENVAPAKGTTRTNIRFT